MKTGIELIAEERKRQVEVEGYDSEHDYEHNPEEFVLAALSYAESSIEYPYVRETKDISDLMNDWPWDPHGYKPTKSMIKDLVKAGALIAAAIDRINALPEESKRSWEKYPYKD